MKALVPLAAACLLLSGCSGERDRAAPVPRLPARVADVLARQSRAVAVSLEHGDSCAARHVFGRLRTYANSEASRAMPRLLRRRVLDAVADLGTRLPTCVPPVVRHREDVPEQARGRGKENGKGKGHGHGKKKGGD